MVKAIRHTITLLMVFLCIAGWGTIMSDELDAKAKSVCEKDTDVCQSCDHECSACNQDSDSDRDKSHCEDCNGNCNSNCDCHASLSLSPMYLVNSCLLSFSDYSILLSSLENSLYNTLIRSIDHPPDIIELI